MMRRPAGLTLALFMFTGAVHAADVGGSYAVKGVGLTKCSDFVKVIDAKNEKDLAQYIGWMGGFLTANNQHQPETFDLTPWQNVRTLASLMKSYCDQNADLRFVVAAARLVQALKADRLTAPSELVPIEHEGRNHYVYKEAIRRAQAKLAERGLYTGDVDGMFGDATRAALETFQKEKDITINGLPDQRTLLVLFQSKS